MQSSLSVSLTNLWLSFLEIWCEKQGLTRINSILNHGWISLREHGTKSISAADRHQEYKANQDDSYGGHSETFLQQYIRFSLYMYLNKTHYAY